jgi:integrase/recombinase XerD
MNWKLEEFADVLRFEQGVGENTIGGYLSIIRNLQKFLAATPISPEGIRAWFREMIAGRQVSPATMQHRRKVLRRFCGWRTLKEKDARWRASIKALEAIRPPRAQRTRKALSKEAVNRWLEKPNLGTPEGRRDRAAMELLYLGLRIGEVIKLEKKDIDLREGFVRVIGKGNKERYIAIPQHTLPILQNFLGNLSLTNGRVFGLCVQSLRRRIKQYAEKAQLEGRVPHELRHSAATHLVQHGASLPAVMQVLGHANLRTTEIYISASALMGFEAMHTCHPRSLSAPGEAAPEKTLPFPSPTSRNKLASTH